MTFADFLIDVPSLVRLALCIALYVTFSILATRIFHQRAILIAQEYDREASKQEAAETTQAASTARAPAPGVKAEDAAKAPTPDTVAIAAASAPAAPAVEEASKIKIPAGYYLSGRGIQLLNVAFVFLLVFTIGQFWNNTRTAEQATVKEAAAHARAGILAEGLNPGAQRQAIVVSLAAYRATVLDKQWPVLQQADMVKAYKLEGDAGRILIAGMRDAQAASEDNANLLEEIGSSLDDITSSGVDRIAALPGSHAPRVLGIIFVLSIVNLGLVIAYQPARRPLNLVVIGLMAAITGLLMFIVVEVSNPFLPGGSVSLMSYVP